MSIRRPFGAKPAFLAAIVAACVLVALPSRAQVPQGNQHAALNGNTPSQVAPSLAVQPEGKATGSSTAAVNTGAPPASDQPAAAQKGIAGKALDKVKEVAKSASDIFNRVPCLSPKGAQSTMGSLPHVAGRLAAGQPVTIVAFGSSSTQGFGSSSPEFTYPNRLAAQLHRQYPGAEINVVNRGKGGEDAPEMMKRLQTEVIDAHPDMVIWQVGTNAVLRNLDPIETEKLVEDGVARIQAGGADIVLVDPQYSPRVTERAESAGKMVKALNKVAELRHIGIFPRFQVMREWHEKQSIPIEGFVIADGLHMNDWGYACFAQLLGDDIIKSVGQIRMGVNVPADVRTYRPM